MNTRTKWTGLAIVLLLAFGALAACVAYPPTPTPTDASRGLQPVDFQRFRVLNDLTVNGDATVSGTFTGDVTGDVTGDLTGNVILEGSTFTATAPLTITGVLTNVILLYEQQ